MRNRRTIRVIKLSIIKKLLTTHNIVDKMRLNFKYFFSVRKIPENQERLRSWFIVKTTPNV